MRIKVEQQEAIDAAQRAKEAAANQHEEESDDMVADDDMGLEESSEEKMTTFDEDLEIVTDFSVFHASEFTQKIMQGQKLKCMLSFAEHTKPSKE